MTKEIVLTRGYKAIVDDDDFEELSKFKWYVSKNKGNFYAQRDGTRNGKSYTVKMHRIVNKTPDGMLTDHINRNGLDNRKENLRSCTVSENSKNSIRKLNKSGLRGVYPSRDKWVSWIRVNGELIYLGTYLTTGDAARAYDNAARKFHGGFAILNEPNK